MQVQQQHLGLMQQGRGGCGWHSLSSNPSHFPRQPCDWLRVWNGQPAPEWSALEISDYPRQYLQTEEEHHVCAEIFPTCGNNLGCKTAGKDERFIRLALGAMKSCDYNRGSSARRGSEHLLFKRGWENTDFCGIYPVRICVACVCVWRKWTARLAPHSSCFPLCFVVQNTPPPVPPQLPNRTRFQRERQRERRI